MILNTVTEIEMLKFLWKWKVASTSALAARFYPSSSLRAAYLRYWKLEEGGFIRAQCSDNGRGFVWMLTKKGFSVMRKHIRENLVEEGYKSEYLGHDILVTAAHLGGFVANVPPGVELVSEQQLRRLHPASLPAWVPTTELHRPDGFWRITNGNGSRVVALEVELSQKNLDQYEQIARYYEDDTNGCEVIWIIDGEKLADGIQRKIKKINPSSSSHSIIAYGDFVRSGWQAKVVAGKNVDLTLYESLEILPRCSSDENLSLRFFDLRKNPTNSIVPANCHNHDFFHCVATTPNFQSKGILSL